MRPESKNRAGLREFFIAHSPEVEAAVRRYLPQAPPHLETGFETVFGAALFGRNHYLLPMFALMGAGLFGESRNNIAAAAAAVEYVRAGAGIFSGLPFVTGAKRAAAGDESGEGVAALAGIALLNAAYPLAFAEHGGRLDIALQVHSEIAECVAGSGFVGGMPYSQGASQPEVAGQSESRVSSGLRIQYESSVLRLAFRIGAILGGANYLELANLSRFAELVGEAFELRAEFCEAGTGIEELLLGDASVNNGSGNITSTIELGLRCEEAAKMMRENFVPCESRDLLEELTQLLAERTV